MLTLTYWGAFIIVAGLVELGFLIARGKIQAWNVLAFGFLVIMGGVAVGNLTDITDILLTLGGGSLHLQRIQEHVDSRAQEIEQIQTNVQSLANEIKKSEQTVATMRDQIRYAFQQMIEFGPLSIGDAKSDAASPIHY